jgi:hypothetical protein
MTNLYDKVEEFVVDAFKKTKHEGQIVHFERTVYWVKKLKPEADEAMLTAAYAHDIERAFSIAKREPQKFESGDILEVHQIEGGKIMYDFLTRNRADVEFAKRVKELIEKHEKGGTEDQNIIKDADSISYFENNAPKHVKFSEKGYAREEIKHKFDWMYDRITSEKAKKITEKWYEKALRDLDKV